MQENHLALDKSAFLIRIGVLPILYALITLLLIITEKDSSYGYSDPYGSAFGGTSFFSMMMGSTGKTFLYLALVYLIIWAIVRLIRSFILERKGQTLEQQAVMRAFGRYFKFRTNFSIMIFLIVIATVTGSFKTGIIFAIAYIVYTMVTMPTDAQIDNWVRTKLYSHESHGLDVLNFDQDELVSENLSVIGLGVVGGNLPYIRIGRDKKMRSSRLGFTTVYFSADLLLVFHKVLDLLNDEVILEKTEEYFYNEVVSLETKRMEWNKIGKLGLLTINPVKLVINSMVAIMNFFFKQNGWTRELSMKTKGGNSFNLYVAEQYSKNNKEIDRSEEQMINALRGIRKMLREKKSDVQ